MMNIRLFARLAAIASLACAGGAQASDRGAACALTGSAREWMQHALEGWAQARDELRLRTRTPPWMVFFDSQCAWHVAPDEMGVPGLRTLDERLRFDGDAVRVAAVPNEHGRIALPGGQSVPVDRMAFTRPYEGSKETYFILALPGLWEPVWRAQDPPLQSFFLSVAMHEMAHTYQLAELARRVEALGSRLRLPANINDDVVETAFSGDAGYRAIFERERDLLFAAVRERDDGRARSLVRQALSLAGQRRARYFTGEHAALAELEPLFLNLEGVGSWIAYRMARHDPARFSFEERVFETSGRSTDWVQGEGLALVILIDRFVPGWQARMLAPELASPFTLLEEAVGPAS